MEVIRNGFTKGVLELNKSLSFLADIEKNKGND